MATAKAAKLRVVEERPEFNSPMATAQAFRRVQEWAKRHPEASRELQTLTREIVSTQDTWLVGWKVFGGLLRQV